MAVTAIMMRKSTMESADASPICRLGFLMPSSIVRMTNVEVSKDPLVMIYGKKEAL